MAHVDETVKAGATRVIHPGTTGQVIRPTDEQTTKDGDTPGQNIVPVPVASLQREAALTTRPNIASQIEPIAIRNGIKLYSSSTPLNTRGSFIILVTGPYGGGKDTILRKALEETSLNMTQPVRYTSRAKRPNEKEGVDYFFITPETAERMLASGEFLLCGELENGCHYATGIESVQSAFSQGQIPALIEGDDEIDAMKSVLKGRNIPYIEIFVSPLSREELALQDGVDRALAILEERMRTRGTSGIEQRLQKSKVLLEHIPDEAKVVKNAQGDLMSAVSDFSSLVQAKSQEVFESLSPREQFDNFSYVSENYFKLHNLRSNGQIAIIITGPSGSGKGSIWAKAIQSNEIKIAKNITNTTRPPRTGEVEGEDYYFLTEEELEEQKRTNELLEWTMVHNGHFYANSEKRLQDIFDSGKDAVLELDVMGANFYRYIFSKFGIPCVDVFISPLSKKELYDKGGIEKAIDVLKQRIEETNDRGTKAQIEDRMDKAREWLRGAYKYTHIIENVDGGLDKAVEQFIEIIRIKKLRETLIKGPLGDLLTEFATRDASGKVVSTLHD